MSAHTPGPWTLRHDFRCADGTLTVGVSAANIGAGSCAVAWPCGTDEAQELANARLIAAAPDLLFALKSCAAVCAGETLNKSALVNSLELARAAIAKATGGQS